MSRNHIHVDAPPAQVWEAIEDPWLYTQWVVGNKRIRAVDTHWPQPGSRFHHTVGVGPVWVRDETVVLAATPARRIELDARVRPLGSALVVVELEPEDGGTRVTITERPSKGPARVMRVPLLDGLARGRNAASLRRLRSMVEQRWARRRSYGG